MNSKEHSLTTSWIWPVDGGVRGLHIDRDDLIMRWYDNFECLCADDGSFAEQTLAEFMARGVPGGIGDVPADVDSEIEETVVALNSIAP